MRISAAAAYMAANRIPNVPGARLGCVPEKRRAAQHHSWGTEPALKRVVFNEGDLNRMQGVALRKTFYRGDISATNLNGQHHA